jgi:hypothetical protein
LLPLLLLARVSQAHFRASSCQVVLIFALVLILALALMLRLHLMFRVCPFSRSLSFCEDDLDQREKDCEREEDLEMD